jgi:hypothetical protein
MSEAAESKMEQKKAAPKKSGPQDVYKYLVCPGNNSRLLLGIFRARPWWQTTKGEPDLVWEMYRNPKRYAATAGTTGSNLSGRADGAAQADW